MTHWTRARGLNRNQRTTTSARLRAIADQYDADHADAVQTNLEAWADPTPWPSSTGGAGSSSEPGSPVEHAIGLGRADGQPTGTTPPMAARAARLLIKQQQLARLVIEVDDLLAEVNPRRVVAYCPNPACGKAVAPGARCTTCSTRQQAALACADCATELDTASRRIWPPDNRRRPGDTQVSVCVKDWMWRYRHDGRPRNGVERLALGDVIEQVDA